MNSLRSAGSGSQPPPPPPRPAVQPLPPPHRPQQANGVRTVKPQTGFTPSHARLPGYNVINALQQLPSGCHHAAFTLQRDTFCRCRVFMLRVCQQQLVLALRQHMVYPLPASIFLLINTCQYEI